MLLFHLAAQKVGQTLPRYKVIIYRPVEGLAGRIIDPVLATFLPGIRIPQCRRRGR